MDVEGHQQKLTRIKIAETKTPHLRDAGFFVLACSQGSGAQRFR